MSDESAPIGQIRVWLLDEVEPAFARELVRRVSRGVTVPCGLAGAPAEVTFRWIDGRRQVDALALLQAFEETTGDPGSAHIGLTIRDMALPVFTHVFGVARHHGRAAVVSLARLGPEFYGLPADPGVTAQRACREILHELGHVLGLEHCPDFECVMHFAPDVENIDLRGPGYCASCRAGVPAGFARG